MVETTTTVILIDTIPVYDAMIVYKIRLTEKERMVVVVIVEPDPERVSV